MAHFPVALQVFLGTLPLPQIQGEHLELLRLGNDSHIFFKLHSGFFRCELQRQANAYGVLWFSGITCVLALVPNLARGDGIKRYNVNRLCS